LPTRPGAPPSVYELTVTDASRLLDQLQDRRNPAGAAVPDD